MRSFFASVHAVLCAALLGCVHPGPVRPAVWSGVTVGGLAVPRAPVLKALREADVIYVGEVHDEETHHAYEAELIEALVRAKLPFVVGWEMFDHSQQALLDQWDRHQLSQAQLFQATGFARTWAVYSPWYGRILQETRRNGIRNLALNALPALVHKIAQGEALTRKEQAQLPRGFQVGKNAFRNFTAMMGAHPGPATDNLRRYFKAQSVWEQTMAASILNFRIAHPGTRVVVLTGRGHLQGGFGTPSYVAQKANVRQVILFPGSTAGR